MDLTINPQQIVIMFFVFLASVITLNVLVFRPTAELLKEREKRLSGLSKEAKALEIRTQSKLDDYTKKMDAARAAARQVRDSLIKTAETEQKAIISKARDESEKLILSAKSNIAQQSSESRLQLRQYAQELSKTMIDKIIKRKVA